MGKNKKSRRRITRRNSNQRSNTSPELSRGPFPMANHEGGIAPETRTDGEGLSSLPNPFEPFPVITDSAAYIHSSAASIKSDSGISKDGKKKHPLFSFKFKDNDRPKSSPASPLPVSSPLPPNTPSKALEMLGFDCDRTRTRSQSLGSRDSDDDDLDDLLVTPTLEQQASLSSLTNLFEAWPVKDTKPKPQSVEPDSEKAKGFWNASTKKVQQMLGFRPKHMSSIKHEADSERSRIELPTLRLREESENYHSSGSDFQAGLPLHLSAPRPIAETSRRRKCKKIPKSLDRMPPITEASHDDLNHSYNDYEHNTELELISEYENGVSEANSFRPPSRSSSLRQPKVWFKSSQEDIFPSEIDSRENNGTRGTESAVKPTEQIELKRLDHRPPAAIPIRSPLQTVEDRLLDATEVNLAALKAKQYENDVSRALLDIEVSALKESHLKMKAKFRAIRPDLLPPETDSEGPENEGEEDLVSIRSSIDLEEEPVVCEAKALTFTRVTPGMVKLIDIPPRKRTHAISPSHKPSSTSPSGPQSPPAVKYCFKNEENPTPFRGRTRDVEPTVIPSYLTPQKHNRAHDGQKANLPREQSRILSQDWAITYDTTKQSPLSGRSDNAMLTRPQIPLAPLLNYPLLSIRPLPPPPHNSSKEHYCIRNGHIFHPINLKTIPNEAAMNSLQVRPYLRTPAGRKEHVHVPVFCDRCDEDVEEEAWECDIAACRLVCCRKCAMDMEREWKERVTDAWKY